jgi:hypothetical protein
VAGKASFMLAAVGHGSLLDYRKSYIDFRESPTSQTRQSSWVVVAKGGKYLQLSQPNSHCKSATEDPNGSW